MAEGPIREPAPAKLNVFLRVLDRRNDGYHEIETLVQPLTLADGVEATPADGLSLMVAGPRAAEAPAGDENLVLRAARALAEAAGIAPRARLVLAKRVPVAAGLGGGSSDAAAALRTLNDLWGCGFDRPRLAEIGARVGSDIPALVPGSAVLARGRGERVEPVAAAKTWWVLAMQPFGVAAADAYGWWDEEGTTGPEPGALVDALTDGDPVRLGPLLYNDLEPGVAARHPEIVIERERLLEAGALGAILCGSGPTVAGLCRDGTHAEGLAASTGGMAVASLAG